MATRWRYSTPVGRYIHRSEHPGIRVVEDEAHPGAWLFEDEEHPTYICQSFVRRGKVVEPPYVYGIIASEITAGGFQEFIDAHFLIQERIGLTTIEQVVARYVKLVSGIPEIREVWLSEDAGDSTIWTIIDAGRFDREPRKKAYSAQYEVVRAMDKPLADFRLLTLPDLLAHGRDHVLPGNRRLVFGT